VRTEQAPWVTIPPRVPRRFFLLVVAVVQVGGTFGASRDQPEASDVDVFAVALLVLGPLALMALWRRPVLSLWVAIGCTVAYVSASYPYGPFVLTPLIAIVHAVVDGRRRAAWVAGAAGVVGVLIGHAVSSRPEDVGWSEIVGVTTWAVIVLVASEVFRTNRERRRQAAIAATELDRRRASEERLQIAQELHDVLAHNISLINVQAGVGLHLMDTRPEQAREALSTIKYASKDALVELRAALDLLRNGEAAPRAPTGGLAHLDGLVARLRSPRLDVGIEHAGTPWPLPSGVDLAAFRIAQEALTNVVRHAIGATRAVVRIEYDDDALTVQVDDDGRAGAGHDRDPAGSGIPGMRARADALAGDFAAGERPGGGFRVRARFPRQPTGVGEPAVDAR
jgi:signal transduction histidine kinase